MKEGWEYKKLKDIATFTRGLTYSKNDEAEISNNIVLRSNNVDLSTGKLNFDELKYLKSEFSIPEEKRVKKGSLLMCMSNGSKIHLGKVALINEDYPYAFGGFMALVTPNEELNPQFFHYSLSSPEYKEFIKKLSEGANINNIKVKELELFTIPIPPLSEQQSIVDYLDSAFAKIDAMKANAEKALNEAKALFQASLKKMLEPKEGWEEKTIGDILNLRRGHDLTHSQMNGCGYPVAGSNGRIGYHNSCTPISPCITVGRSGSVGAVNIYKECWAHNTTLYIDDFKGNYPKYLYYLLKSIDLAHLNSGSAVPTLNRNFIHPIIVPYVKDIVAQQSIVATLDNIKSKVDRLQANNDKISQECDALKQAILRQVFE